MRVLSYSDLQYFSCFDAEIELLQNCNVLPDDPVFASPHPTDKKTWAFFSPSAAIVLDTVWKWKLEIKQQMEKQELDVSQMSEIL